MSKSYKRNPVSSVLSTRPGEVRRYKQQRARRERACLRVLRRDALLGDEEATEQMAVELAPWNEWDCPRDGKRWLRDPSSEDLRK